MAATSAEEKHDRAVRGWSRVLSLWHLCGNAACIRARACRGNIRACGPRTFALLPPGVQDWFACLLEAKDEGLSFDEALRRIDETPAAQAFAEWNAAVAASGGEQPRDRRHDRRCDQASSPHGAQRNAG